MFVRQLPTDSFLPAVLHSIAWNGFIIRPEWCEVLCKKIMGGADIGTCCPRSNRRPIVGELEELLNWPFAILPFPGPLKLYAGRYLIRSRRLFRDVGLCPSSPAIAELCAPTAVPFTMGSPCAPITKHPCGTEHQEPGGRLDGDVTPGKVAVPAITM